MTRSDPLAHLHEELGLLEARGLRRRSPLPSPGAAVSFCSNDYLGLASQPAPAVAAGAGASRLLGGESEEHRALEAELALWLGTEACLLFSSGYAANVGALSALARPGDLLVSDALNHASLIDGARLCSARIVITDHNDLRAIARALGARTEERAWVVVESYYSMDADGPDLAELRRICDEAGAALIVDEAHALGVLGPGGRGRLAEVATAADVVVGTLGKAFGSQGAFIAGRSVLRDWLFNRARSFVYSTALAPAAAAAARRALRFVQESAEILGSVTARADRLRSGLRTAAPAGAVRGFGHIVPVVLGDSRRTVAIAEAMIARGVHVLAVRPPTVPDGTARLRFTVTAGHRNEDIDRAVEAMRACLEQIG